METIKESSLTVKDIHVDMFVPNAENINEMDEDALKALCDNISEHGFIDPVNAVPNIEGKYVLLGGEHRWKAAKRLGMSYIPTVVMTDAKWSDSDVFDLISFRMNNIKGSQNPEKFIKLYDRLAKKFGAESLKDVFSVTDKSLWKKLTKSIKDDAKKAGMSDETVKEIDEAEKKAKNFNQFSGYMNKIFANAAVPTGCILFTNGNQEYMVVNASRKVFDSMKALSSYASARSKNVNDLLEGTLVDLLSKI